MCIVTIINTTHLLSFLLLLQAASAAAVTCFQCAGLEGSFVEVRSLVVIGWLFTVTGCCISLDWFTVRWFGSIYYCLSY